MMLIARSGFDISAFLPPVNGPGPFTRTVAVRLADRNPSPARAKARAEIVKVTYNRFCER